MSLSYPFRLRQSMVMACLALLSACATKPAPAKVEHTEEVSATVESVDMSTRLVALRSLDGRQVTLQVDPAVRNLAQVKPGDRVVARYHQALAAELRKRGDGSGTTTAPVVESTMDRAAPGAKPSASAGRKVSQTVRITSVDNKTHVVSFYGSDGLARSVPVLTPQGQEFISKLKAGDEVELTYTEAVAVSVEPAK